MPKTSPSLEFPCHVLLSSIYNCYLKHDWEIIFSFFLNGSCCVCVWYISRVWIQSHNCWKRKFSFAFMYSGKCLCFGECFHLMSWVHACNYGSIKDRLCFWKPIDQLNRNGKIECSRNCFFRKIKCPYVFKLGNAAFLFTYMHKLLYQDPWKTTLLLRVKEKLKAKELEEDDLT